MFSDLSLKAKGFVLVLVPVLFEICFVVILAALLYHSSQEFDEIEHNNAVLMSVSRMVSTLSRGTAMLMSGRHLEQKERLDQIDLMIAVIGPESEALYASEKSPDVRDICTEWKEMRRVAMKVLTQERSVIAEPATPGIKRQHALGGGEIMVFYVGLRDLSKRVVQVETRTQATTPEEIDRFRLAIITLLSIGVLLSVAITLILALLVTTDIIERLSQIAKNARLMATGKELSPPREGEDEIAELDRVLYESSLIISESRRKELAVLDNAADVICSLDNKLRFIAAGAASAKVWKYSPSDLRGMQLASLLTSDTIEPTRQALQLITVQAREGQAREGEVENVVRCHDGLLKNSLWSVRWSSEERSYYCVVHDVTELRAIENLKKQFLSMVSHDLRTPLMSVGVSLALLTEGKRGDISEPVLQMIGKAQRGMQRLMELVNELLELEKLESGKMRLDLECVSASDVCAAAKESLESMARMARVTIAGPSGEAAVSADEGRLVQAVINLLSNSIKFSPPGSTVSLAIVREDRLSKISVADQGPGIPEDQLALLFEKFTQTKAVSHVAVKGTGLGLAITKAIIEAHGGEIGVDSQVGKGSTFWIKVPLFFEKDEVLN